MISLQSCGTDFTVLIWLCVEKLQVSKQIAVYSCSQPHHAANLMCGRCFVHQTINVFMLVCFAVCNLVKRGVCVHFKVATGTRLQTCETDCTVRMNLIVLCNKTGCSVD